MNTPTTIVFLQFLTADGDWKPVRNSNHRHYEKTLADGTVLLTHVSFGKKPVSADTFKDILNYQLAVTEDQFWDTIRLKKSQRTTVVVAPAELDPLTLALRRELMRRLHYTDEQIIRMTGAEAKRLLADLHEKLK